MRLHHKWAAVLLGLSLVVMSVISVSTVSLAKAASAGRVPVGATPDDYGLLRLWLPPGWTTSTSCHNRSNVVYYPPTFEGGPPCTVEPLTESVTVAPFTGPAPQTASPIRRNGVEIFQSKGSNGGGVTVWDILTLRVQLTLLGNQAVALANSLRPSPLQDLMTVALPIRVPTRWKIIRFDGFLAKVPPTWPIHYIQITHHGNESTVRGLPPGVCGPPLFGGKPGVYLGKFVPMSCPADLSQTLPPTDDGIWLSPTTDNSPLQVQPSSEATLPQRLIAAGGTQTLIRAGGPTGATGDSVDVEIATRGKRISATIGLGRNPAIAEAILSSIAPD